MAGTVTTQRIAREAGLSQPTVSLILNRRGDEMGIKRETQERVFEIAKRLNYVRNPLANGLRGGRTKTIGMLWSLESPHGDMAREMALRVQKYGYVANLADFLGGLDLITQALADCARRRVDGLVLQADRVLTAIPEVQRLLKEFPAAVVVSPDQLDIPFDVIHHDRLSAFEEAADHLVGAGRKRIAFVAYLHANVQKWKSFSGRLMAHGFAPDQMTAIDFQHNLRDDMATLSALEEHCKDGVPFDAFVCVNDVSAVAVMAWLRARGLRVPEDVAVIGTNDTPIAPYQVPPLASIAREDKPVADLIEQMLFARLADPNLEPRRERINMRFVPRESAG